MTADDLPALVEAVRANAHVADARHAGDLTLCIYLLQMREFFRWERGVAFDAPLERDAVGNWISEREALWDRIADDGWRDLPLGRGHAIDPFDAEAIDARLRPLGLTYGAGLLGPQRPVFFLAHRHADECRDGVPVRVAGRELVRGLQAPVATLAGTPASPAIVVRRESLARWCWERVEAYRLRPRTDSAQHAAMQAYGLDVDFAAALPRWLDDQTEAAVLHEQGERLVGQRLGDGWVCMRLDMPTRRGELAVRAVRDLLADLTLTLPTLLERQARGPLHVWFANFEGFRLHLYPGLVEGYRAWRDGDGGQALQAGIARGLAHFDALAQAALALHGQQPDRTGAADVERLLHAPEAVCGG